MAGMLNFEAQHNNGWGIIMDYAFMVDYDNEKALGNGFFEYNTTTHGPLVGLKIEF
jgi:hypothetical protein